MIIELNKEQAEKLGCKKGQKIKIIDEKQKFNPDIIRTNIDYNLDESTQINEVSKKKFPKEFNIFIDIVNKSDTVADAIKKVRTITTVPFAVSQKFFNMYPESTPEKAFQKFWNDVKGINETIQIDEQEVDIKKSIEDFINVNWSKSDESRGKAMNILKGLIFSDDPIAKKFITDLDKKSNTLNINDYK